MKERIEKLRTAIETIHKCKAAHERSIVLLDLFKSDTAWTRIIESFTLTGHPRAKRCFAWSYRVNGETQFINVLEIPPVVSSQKAVRTAIVSKRKKRKRIT
jgi:hypothetical protein